jgi:predicted RNA-binding protein with PIN domain
MWIMDGHNMIFALGELQRLQTSERGEEARSLLIERLETFALHRGERILVVFDGKDRDGPPGDSGARLLQAVYARGGGGADRRILDEARRRAGRGEAVTVVTDDIRTLAVDLPRGVRHMRVREFWMAHIEVPLQTDEKPVAGDFSDMERALLAMEQDTAALRPGQGRAGAHRPALEPSGKAAWPERRLIAASRPEAVLRKRERGRLRHERSLKRRSGRSGEP